MALWIASSSFGSVFENGQKTGDKYDGFVSLASELFDFILQFCYEQVHFTFVHLVFRFCAGSLTLAAALIPLRWFLRASACSLRYASDLPNGEPSRMLKAFGRGQSVSSIFILRYFHKDFLAHGVGLCDVLRTHYAVEFLAALYGAFDGHGLGDVPLIFYQQLLTGRQTAS